MVSKKLVKQREIHRDLKSANIHYIFKIAGINLYLDFGFAKYGDNYTSQLLRFCVGFTLYKGSLILQRKIYSTKCDILTIGVIFYEMVFQIVQIIDIFQQMKQDINFHHFLNLELYQISQIDQKNIQGRSIYLRIYSLIIKTVLAYNYLLVQLIQETSDSKEDMLIKGTKWNRQNCTKQEQEYYKIFFICKDSLFKDSIQFDEQMSDIERNKLEDNIINKIIGVNLDDLKKRLLKKITKLHQQQIN